MSDSPVVVEVPGPWSLRDAVALLSLFLAASLFWYPGLGEGYWIDEAISRDTASETWPGLLARAGFGDVHPPLYYGLLKIWTALFGLSDLAGRALSVVLGSGAIALMYLRVRNRTGWVAALVGAGLLVLCPLTAHYAVEVRSYALLLFLSLASVMAFEGWLERPASHQRLGLCVLTSALLVLTHYFGWLWVALLILYGALCVSRERGAVQRWFLLCLWTLGVSGLWLPLLLVQVRHLPAGITAHLSSSLPPLELVALFGPGAAHPSVVVAALTGALVLGLGAWGAWRSGNGPSLDSGQPCPPISLALFIPPLLLGMLAPLVPLALLPMSDLLLDLFLQELQTAYVLLVMGAGSTLGFALVLPRVPQISRGRLEVSVLLTGALVLGVLSVFRPVLISRNLILFLPPVLSLFSWALIQLPRWSQLTVVLWCGIVVGTSVPGMGERFEPRPDLRGAAERIDRGAQQVVVWPRWDAPGIAHYAAMTPVGILESDELPEPRGDTFDVVLTRESAVEADRYLGAVQTHLGPHFSRSARWDGRRIVWCRFQRRTPP